MSPQIWNAVWLALVFLILFGGAELLHRSIGVPSEWSRKFLHVSGGLLSLVMPKLFDDPWIVFALAAAFFLLLWSSRKLGLLDSVHRVDRPSEGSLLFPVPILICFWLAWHQEDPRLFYLPVLILTLADPAAAFTGTFWRWRPYRVGSSWKTLGGSLAFAAVAFGLALWFMPEAPWKALLLTIFVTITEAFSGRGWDNLSVPLAAAGVLSAL